MENKEELRQRIRDAYDKLLEDRTTHIVPGTQRVIEYANQNKRNSLIKAMQNTYSEEEKIAIYLHSILCHMNHTDMCSWYNEMKHDRLEDDFSRYNHRIYLKKARAVIQAGYSIEDLKKIHDAINID